MSNQDVAFAREKYWHKPGDGGKGGLTVCWLLNAEGIPIVFGYAICSRADSYSRKRGRMIAKGRALKVLRTNLPISTHAGKIVFQSCLLKDGAPVVE